MGYRQQTAFHIVVWYQDSEAKSSGKTKGSNVAYLYSKENAGEVVAEIPNYVAATSDGKIVVYDGAHTLYKVPLYTEKEIIKLPSTSPANAVYTLEKLINKWSVIAE